MSILKKFKSYVPFLREISITDLDNDPLVEMLKADMHPSPSDIEEYRGKLTICPFILADATYLNDARRTNESALVHFANTEIRPKKWNLGFANDDEDMIVLIYTHDMGEDKANDTVAGNYAIVRIPAVVFGQHYYEPMMSLTNVRSTIYKQLYE